MTPVDDQTYEMLYFPDSLSAKKDAQYTHVQVLMDTWGFSNFEIYWHQRKQSPLLIYCTTWNGTPWWHNYEPLSTINTLYPGRCGSNFDATNLKLIIQESSLDSLWNYSKVNASEDNIDAGNSLFVHCNKPLPESILTKLYATEWGHYVALS